VARLPEWAAPFSLVLSARLSGALPGRALLRRNRARNLGPSGRPRQDVAVGSIREGSSRWRLVAALLLTSSATVASAEMVKCKNPDGSIYVGPTPPEDCVPLGSAPARGSKSSSGSSWSAGALAFLTVMLLGCTSSPTNRPCNPSPVCVGRSGYCRETTARVTFFGERRGRLVDSRCCTQDSPRCPFSTRFVPPTIDRLSIFFSSFFPPRCPGGGADPRQDPCTPS
jgi:hypothetical protein